MTAPMFDESDSDVRFVLRWLRFKARQRTAGMPVAMDVEDLVQPAYMAYQRGVVRNGMEWRPVRDRVNILRQRMLGQMTDELRRMGPGTRGSGYFRFLSIDYETDSADDDFSPEEHLIPPEMSAECTAVVNVELDEIMKLVRSRFKPKQVGMFLRWLHGDTLEAIGDYYNVSGSRVSQVVAEIRKTVKLTHSMSN